MRIVLLLSVLLVSTVAGHKSTAGYVSPVRSVTRAQAAPALTETRELSTNAGEESTAITTTASSSSSSSSSAKPTTQTAPLTTSAALKPSSTELPPPKEESSSTEALTELPVSLPTALLPPAESDNDLDGGDLTKRRLINYDQRQEGQYNIRADLENFMIVLIPPNPSDGLNLLDLLTKSALRRSSQANKQKRRHFGSALQSGAAKYRQALRTTHGQPSFQFISRQPENAATRSSYLHTGAHALSTVDAVSAMQSTNRLGDFIEGRTPYHVDISASDDEQARLHTDRQVDVLPPPYPLAYQHLIKPYHLEAEPTVIQALPPAELSAAAHASGNFLESYNQLLASSLPPGNNAVDALGNGLQAPPVSTTARTVSARASDGGGYFRISRAIRGDNYLDSNRVTALNSLNSAPRYADAQPIYREEHSLGAAELYPPIDVPRLYLQPHMNARNFELQDVDEREQLLDDDSHVGEYIVPPADLPAEDDIEWGRLLDTFMKDMRTARCAPGHRRDSYGVCREIDY